MDKRDLDKIKIVTSDTIRINGLTCFHHEIGYFKQNLDMGTTTFLCEIVRNVCQSSEQALMCFYPLFNPEEWARISEDNWVTVHQTAFKREGFLNRNKEFLFVTGYARNWEKFCEVFNFAWYSYLNETFLVIDNRNSDILPIKKYFIDGFEANPVNEHRLVKYYPTILSRFFDGDRLSIFSTCISSEILSSILETSLRKCRE